MRARWVGLSITVVAGAIFALFQCLAGATAASAASGGAAQRVIVVFKDQDPAQPATRADIASRRSTFAGAQASVLSELRANGASDIQTYSIIDALAATISSDEVSRLKADPAVEEVIPDQLISVGPTPSQALADGTAPIPSADARTVTRNANRSTDAAPAAAGSSLCSSNPAQPQLNPQALELIGADSDQAGAQTARSLGFTGAGVKVAFIADDLDITDPDFIRPDGQPVFVDYKDFTGQGTNTVTGGEEAFGDAASIAAQGNQVYNVAGFGPHAVASPCYIKIEGVAPGASLVGLDVFGANDAGFNSNILDAINYAVTTDHVNVLNESLGSNFYPDDAATLDVIKAANDAAIAAGTTVTVSSGDAGVTSTIGTPATDPKVISAGATTSYRIDLQDGYGGAQFPGVTGYLDDNISSFSSGGFDQPGQTVDVVAPGELGWSLCSTDDTVYEDCTNFDGDPGQPTNFLPFGGTSEAAPLTAGVAALVDQAYMKTHGSYPTPAVVKEIITSTADDIRAPADQQGAGLINADQAVLAAESYGARGGSRTGETLLKSRSQFNLVGLPKSRQALTETVTNNGAATEHLAISSRQIGAYTTVRRAVVTLADGISPQTTDWLGVPANYETVPFTVKAGEARLNIAAAFQQAQTDSTDPPAHARVRLTLVDPQGRLAGYSVPQGDGNYGDLQITDPAPGKWTAYVWSRTSAGGGTTGPVVFGASVAKYVGFGTVSPSRLTLAPGRSASVKLRLTLPSTPGDTAGSLVFSGAALRTSTVPVTVRALVPEGRESFQGTLTGGNGREIITGQSFYYQLDVGAHRPELNAAVALADNPNNPFGAFLVGPNGEAQAFASNALLNGGANAGITNELGAQLHVLHPAQGAWTLIVLFAPTVSGTALSEPFTVSTSESAVPVSTSGGRLPDSTSVALTRGKAVRVEVDVTNTGPTPESYFLDGRLSQKKRVTLTSLTAPVTTVPLTSTSNFPEYLVPTDSTALRESAATTGPTPIEFDSSSPAGDPDIESTAGSAVTAALSGAPLAPGAWSIDPDVTGAYTTSPAPTEPVTTSMSVTTDPFDPAVSSRTGDLWQASTNPAALASLSPVIVGAGRRARILVTITPTGRKGSIVRGVLYVDDVDPILFDGVDTPNGNQVAAIPYTYRIK